MTQATKTKAAENMNQGTINEREENMNEVKAKAFKTLASKNEVDTNWLDYQDAYQTAFLKTLEDEKALTDLMEKHSKTKNEAFRLLVRRTTENKRSKRKTIEKYETLLDETFIDVIDKPQISYDLFGDEKKAYQKEQNELKAFLRAKMSDGEAYLFDKYYVEGLTQAEIAAECFISQKAVSKRLAKVQRILDTSEVKAFYSETYCETVGQITGKKAHTEQKYNVNGLTVMEPSKIKTLTVKKRNKALKNAWKQKQAKQAADLAYFDKTFKAAFVPYQVDFDRSEITYTSGLFENVCKAYDHLNLRNKEHFDLYKNRIEAAFNLNYPAAFNHMKETADTINNAWHLYRYEKRQAYQSESMAQKAKVKSIKASKSDKASDKAESKASKASNKAKAIKTEAKPKTVKAKAVRVILRKKAA